MSEQTRDINEVMKKPVWDSRDIACYLGKQFASVMSNTLNPTKNPSFPKAIKKPGISRRWEAKKVMAWFLSR